MTKKSLNKKTAEEAIRFLDTHMLDPTPGNYTFAYLYLTGTTGSLRKEVDGLVYDGVRLKQEVVDEIMRTTSESAGVAIPADIMELQSALRRQSLSFADLASRSLKDTGDFSRDLKQGAEQALAGADIAQLIGVMVERTAQVERKLAETVKETERLRMDLDAARDDATRDALTNLPNRRAADRKLAELTDGAKQVAVAFCDIDHFKSINDRFGHDVGDRVLKAVADTLSETLAPHLIARFGGEEFVVILPDVSGQEAYRLVDLAREAVAAKNFKVRDSGETLGKVTFSAGIATTSSDPEGALKTADESLYEAKSSGRNKTIYKTAA
jgi:diguanylate cyclase